MGNIYIEANVKTRIILEWLDKHKWQSSINYKDKEFKGKIVYPKVYICEDRMVLDKFVEAFNISRNSIEGFMAHDIRYVLSSP